MVDVLLHLSSSHELVLDAIQGIKPWGKIILCGIGFDEMNLPALGLTSNSLQVIGSDRGVPRGADRGDLRQGRRGQVPLQGGRHLLTRARGCPEAGTKHHRGHHANRHHRRWGRDLVQGLGLGPAGTGRVAKAVLIGAVPPLMVQTPENPGGLPLEVFDGFRASLAANRSQFYLEVASGPFYGFNRPGADMQQSVIWNWWRQGMTGSAKAHYDGIEAFSETDFTDDLKALDVPTLVMHGDDDQVVVVGGFAGWFNPGRNDIVRWKSAVAVLIAIVPVSQIYLVARMSLFHRISTYGRYPDALAFRFDLHSPASPWPASETRTP